MHVFHLALRLRQKFSQIPIFIIYWNQFFPRNSPELFRLLAVLKKTKQNGNLQINIKMRRFAPFGTIYKKHEKHPWRDSTFSKVAV